MITAAICTSGERSTLQGTLSTLLAQTQGSLGELEVLVVDNSRGENDFVFATTRRFVASASVPVRYVREARVGLGFARNAAIRAAHGEIVAFLDDDVLVDPNWLSALADAYRDTDAVAVGGRIRAVWGAERPEWLGEELYGFLSILDYGPVRRQCRFPHYPFGANISFRRDLLLELGGFATALGGGGAPTYLMDEIELCRRIEKAGKPIFYAPSASVGHIVPPSRMTRGFFVRRAVALGRATARMGRVGLKLSRLAALRGLPAAASRSLGHGLRVLWFALSHQGRPLVSEGRHLAWNLGWMWETSLMAVGGQ